MKRKLYLLFAALAVVLTLSACGGNNAINNGNGANAPSPANGGGAAGGAEKDITVSATNFEFDQKDIKLNVGDTVNLTLKNVNGNHGLEIPDLDVNIMNGETKTFTVDKAGTYEYHCSIQCGSGHNDMVGTITVS